MNTLTKHFQERIVLLLSEYLKDLSTRNISQLSLGINSNLVMENLEIREDLLLMNGIPLMINEGRINKILITIPTLYKTTPARIDIEDVIIRTRLLVEHRDQEEVDKAAQTPKQGFQPERNFGVESFKEKKLNDWEAKIKRYFKELAPPTWAKKIIDSILLNMIITIKNVNIYYESTTLLTSPSLAKLSLKELSIHTTNENWVPGFNSKMDVKFREVSLCGLSITLNVNKPKKKSTQVTFSDWLTDEIPQRKNKTKTATLIPNEKPRMSIQSKSNNPTPAIPRHRKSKYEIIDHEELEFEYRKLRENDVYLLYPLDMTIRLKKTGDQSKDFHTEPQELLWIETKDPIILMLNKDHMQFLGALSNHFKAMNLVHRNLHLRPNGAPKKMPKEWFIYAIKAVIEDKKRAKDFSKDPSSLIKMKKYIDLYKRQQTIIAVPWLPRINDKEKPVFKMLEEVIPLENLIKFREWAFIEIRLEAKRFANSNKDTYGMKPLIDIWFYVLYNDDMFAPAQKADKNETIRLTPREQTDLYEILALDKARVLESYLKGEKNDPKDIAQNLAINIRSFYLFITEPKKRNYETLDCQNQKLTSVKSWWSLPEKQFENLRSTGHFPSETTKDKSDQQATDLGFINKNIQLADIPLVNPFLRKQISGNGQNNETQKSESFQEHLRDVEKEGGSKFLDEESGIENLNDKKKNPLETDYFENIAFSKTWWNQNLLLIIEILHINTSINKYKNGKRTTDQKDTHIGSIMITTALNLSQAIKQRKARACCAHSSLNFNSLFENILAFDFSTSVPSSTNHDTNPLIKYLREKGHNNFSSFLELSNKYKNKHGEISSFGNIKLYRPFFNQDDPLYIDIFSEDTKMKFHSCLMKKDISHGSKELKENVINEAYNELGSYISQNLLSSFLFSYGVLVLSLLLQANISHLDEQENNSTTIIDFKRFGVLLKKIKEFPSKMQDFGRNIFNRNSVLKPQTSQESVNAVILSFNVEGSQTDFQIKKIDLAQAEKTNRLYRAFTFEADQVKETPETQPFVRLHMKPLTIHLSTDSLKPLTVFFKSFSSTSKKNGNNEFLNLSPEEESNFATVKDYETIIDCIRCNSNEEKENNFKDGPQVEALFNRITLKIYNLGSTYLHNRDFSLNLRDIEISVKRTMDLGFSSKNFNATNPYKQTNLQIEEIEFVESYIDGYKQNNISLLNAKVILHIYDCIYKNHALYTDKKIHILLPYIYLNIDDGAVLFYEVLKLLRAPASKNQDKTEKNETYSEKFGMGKNQYNSLINRFKALRNDHQSSNKVCKHCILRYKKSQYMLNLFIGNLMKYSAESENSPFHHLYLSSLNSKQINDGLVIRIIHSLDKTENRFSQPILDLPFLALTRDQGFFKDNIVVQCTESRNIIKTSQMLNCQGNDNAILHIKPLLKTSRDFIERLDKTFWSYFLDLEKFLKKKGTTLTRQNSEVITFRDTSIAKGKRSTFEKLFSMDNIEEDTRDDSSQVYVLFARKKNLRKHLAKHFDIVESENNLKNFLILKIDQLSLTINSFSGFLTVKTAFDTIKSINKWLEHYLKISNSKNLEKAKVNSSRAPPNYMTLSDVDQAIYSEEISLTINQVSALIKIDPPKTIWFFEIDQVCFETFFKRSFKSGTEINGEDVWNLFFINRIKFGLTSLPSGNIGKIKLKYYKSRQKFELSIQTASYNSSNKGEKPLFQSPVMDSVGAKQKYFVKMEASFQENLLNKINVNISPILLSISTHTLAEDLCSFALISKFSRQQKKTIPLMLATEVFEKTIFEGVQQSLIQSQHEQETFEISIRNDVSHFGSFAASNDISITVIAEGLKAHCIANSNGTEFSVIDISDVKMMMNISMDYDINIGKLSIKPYDSYYHNAILSMVKDEPFTIRIIKEKSIPVINVKNSKIIYMNRAIGEMREFIRLIQSEIQLSCQRLAEAKSIPILPEPPEDPTDQKEIVFPTTKSSVAKIIIEDSCLVIPRNTQSKDIFVLMFKKLEAFIDNEVKNLEIPFKLENPFNIISSNLIIEKDEQFSQVKVPVRIINGNVMNLDIFYVVGKRKVNMGSFEKAYISQTTPLKRLVNEKWIFDSLIQASFENFNLPVNIASLTEVEVLVNTNLRETSKVFKFKAKEYAKTQFVLRGNDVGLDMNTIKIPGDFVREILSEQENQQKSELEKIPSNPSFSNLQEISKEFLALKGENKFNP